MNILIIQGHPNLDSLNWGLAKAYKKGALEKGHKVVELNVVELNFDYNFFEHNSTTEGREPDIEKAIKALVKADHLVWFFPVWWQGIPAVLKAFVDRTFLPGVAYKYEKGKVLQQKLFKGKTAEIIATSDTPKWYSFLYLKSPALNQMKKGVLAFSGVKTKRVHYFSPVRKSTSSVREKWKNQVYQSAKNR